MKIPNAERALIAPEKLRDYLLNVAHERGGTKARLLIALGYARQEWSRLESDLRDQHLPRDVESVESNEFGIQYAIEAEIRTPSGQSRRFRSIWQVDRGTDLPRFITMYPT
jgi:hypothetical protein